MDLQPRVALHAGSESVWSQSDSKAGVAYEDCRGGSGVTGIGEAQVELRWLLLPTYIQSKQIISAAVAHARTRAV